MAEFLTEDVKQKWAKVIEHPDLPAINETWKKKVTTVMLENTARELGKANMITEDAPANQSGAFPNATNLKGFDPILISLIRRAMPNLIAYDLCGVQPMTGPTGLIFAMKSKYNSQGDAEALFYEANTAFSSAGLGSPASQTGTLPAGNSSGTTTSNGLANSTNYTYAEIGRAHV